MIRINSKNFEHSLNNREYISYKEIYRDSCIKIAYFYDKDKSIVKIKIKLRNKYKNVIYNNTLFIVNGMPKKVTLVHSDSIIRIFRSASKKEKPNNYIVTVL